jgi:excisionase family DNA binding protein
MQGTLTTSEVAELLKVDPQTVRNWHRDGLLPPAVRLGERGHFRWPEKLITEFLERQPAHPERAA